MWLQDVGSIFASSISNPSWNNPKCLLPLLLLLSRFSRVWLFMTPWTTYSLPGSSIHGILQARVLEWGASSSSVYSWGTFNYVTQEVLWQLCFTPWRIYFQSPLQGERGSSSQKRFNSHLSNKSFLVWGRTMIPQRGFGIYLPKRTWTLTERLDPTVSSHTDPTPRAQFNPGPARK